MTTEYSIQKMVSDGTLSTITLGIQYLQRSDIYMRIAGEETPQSGAPSGYTWSFVDNTTIKILPVVPNGVEVVVYRRTDANSMYNVYSQNAQFDEATIDENNTQLLFLSQEYLEQGSGIEAVEYLRSEGEVHYYRLQLYGGRYTDEFTITTQLPPGYIRGSGDFATGFTVMPGMRNVVWLNPSPTGDNNLYSWSGEVPPTGKVVPPNSTPETTGGFVNAWIPRTDETLRQELSAPGGAGVVGYSAGDPSYFSVREVADYLKQSLWFDDFKGATDDEKWASLAAYVSTAVVPSVCVMFSARKYTFSSNPATLTKPFELHGQGARNTILQFNDCDGVRGDLSGYAKYCQSKIAHMSIVANSVNSHTGVYFKGFQTFSPHDSALVLDNVSVYGLREIDAAAPISVEWAIAVHLDDVDSVTIRDLFIAGSQKNVTYAGRTTSKGILVDTVTGLWISTSSIFMCREGIEIFGQSEGSILDGLTIVATDIGILFRDLVGPANNHIITNSHFSTYTKGISIAKLAEAGKHSLAAYLSNLFVLEREGNASKPLYTAIEAYTIRSCLDNITIQSNRTLSPNRKGIVISNQDNYVSNVLGFNVGELLNIDHVGGGRVFYSNLRTTGATTAVISGGVRYAVGAGAGGESAIDDYTVRANTFKALDSQGLSIYECSVGRHLFGGGRQNTSVYHDFRTFPGGTAAYDGRILFTGGNASVDGKADLLVLAGSVSFDGNISPRVPNSVSCGTSAKPWSGGFTQTAFTVTSDERYKTRPLEITDAMLDAAAEVDWCMFQYLDRVEEKGADGARWHFGAIAQRFVEAFERHGLDPHRFAFICYDEWGDSPELIGEDGEVISPAVDAGSRYGIRYEQAIILKQKQIDRDHKRQLDSLLARIEALENKP